MIHIPQRYKCHVGLHYWTGWTNWTPVQPSPLTPMPDANTPIRAYRRRFCECGAWERETYGTGERIIYNTENNHD